MADAVVRSILDVPGIRVGHAQDFLSKTGCTIVLCPDGAVAGMDIRGSAAGTRQTDALSAQHSVPQIHGIMMVGGSSFGLDATGGALRYLEERSIGYDVLVTKIPIIPTAVIFDLGFGRFDVRPDERMGYEACQNASSLDLPEGSVGAGAGASVGKFYGIDHAMKGGVGSWSEALPGGVIVGAVVVVNAFGDVLAPDGAKIIAGARTSPTSHEFANTVRLFREGKRRRAFMVDNTTLGVVATNAALTKNEASKMARICQNGLAKSVAPAHTTFDGDIIFGISTGDKECDLNGLCVTAESVMRTAIHRAITRAHGFAVLPSYREIFPDTID